MEPERTRQGGIRVKTREDAVAACMMLGGCYEDYPFDDPNWTVMRHCGSRRSFALIFEREGRIWVNVKAEPMWGEHWRRTGSGAGIPHEQAALDQHYTGREHDR